MTLSDKQMEIVTSTERNIIVDAGAGSGKTRVLTERVKHLLKKGVDPKSMVIITFTNMAADELLSRLNTTKGYKDCFIGTIHSYANKLLKKSGYNFEIFSESKQDEFMKYLIEKYAKYATYEDYELLKYLFKSITLGKIDKFSVQERFSSPRVYEELEILLGKKFDTLNKYPHTVPTLCKLNNVISFDELIELAKEHFESTGVKLGYLFVDELQDIGYLEYNFLKELNAENNFYIGDDYQAIFAFKGGDVGIFLSLMNHPDWQVYYLEDNYRNGQFILDVANNVIGRADNIIKKESNCMRNVDGEVKFMSNAMLEKFLCSIKGEPDWFVLTRLNKEIDMISKILKKNNIPYVCFKQSKLTPKQLRDAMNFRGIKLLTIHSSKGLESKNVAIYGNMPVNPKKSSNTDEIKLFYVALTRASDKVVIFS